MKGSLSDSFGKPDVQNEFYERRPSPFKNQLIKEFASPNERVKSLSEQSKLFDYTGIQKSPPQAEIMVLERKQVDLIDSHPLGFARCQQWRGIRSSGDAAMTKQMKGSVHISVFTFESKVY